MGRIKEALRMARQPMLTPTRSHDYHQAQKSKKRERCGQNQKREHCPARGPPNRSYGYKRIQSLAKEERLGKIKTLNAPPLHSPDPLPLIDLNQ